MLPVTAASTIILCRAWSPSFPLYVTWTRPGDPEAQPWDTAEASDYDVHVDGAGSSPWCVLAVPLVHAASKEVSQTAPGPGALRMPWVLCC